MRLATLLTAVLSFSLVTALPVVDWLLIQVDMDSLSSALQQVSANAGKVTTKSTTLDGKAITDDLTAIVTSTEAIYTKMSKTNGATAVNAPLAMTALKNFAMATEDCMVAVSKVRYFAALRSEVLPIYRALEKFLTATQKLGTKWESSMPTKQQKTNTKKHIATATDAISSTKFTYDLSF